MWPSFILTSIYNNLYIICEGGVLVETSNFNWSIKYIITTENVPMLPLLQQFGLKKVNPGSKTTVTLFLFSFLLKNSQLCQIILLWMCNFKRTLMEYVAILVSTHHLWLLIVTLASSHISQCKYILATAWIISECFHMEICFLQLPSNTMTIQLSVAVGIVQSRHYHYIIISKIYC